MATPPQEPREQQDAADVLYAVAPQDFVAARDAAAARARATGDKAAASALKALRRPTVAAWMVNALLRDDRAVVEQFLELGAALADAQSSLRGGELRALSAQRSQLVTSLVARAERLAEAAGVRADSAALGEVQDTLGAALADAHAASEVRSGRLTRGLSHAGFGGEPPIAAGPGRPQGRTAASPPPAARRQAEAERAAAAEAARQAALRTAALDKATRELSVLEQAQADARAVQEDVDAALGQAREQVRDLERRAAEAALESRAAAAAAGRARSAVAALQQPPLH